MKKGNRLHSLTGLILAALLAAGISYSDASAVLSARIGFAPGIIISVEAASAKVYYATSGLNVRESAGTSASIVGSLAAGEAVSVNSISDGWAEITYNGSTAYVSAKYLSASPQSTKKSSAGSAAAGASRAAASSGTVNNEVTVWLSATGNKYHSRNNCGRMNPSKARQTTMSKAKASGYEACKKCW